MSEIHNLNLTHTVSQDDASITNSLVFKPDLATLIKCDNLLKINGTQIIVRKVDGFVNVTHLCKAGGKEFKHWKENKKTTDFLSVLSSSVEKPTDALIKYVSGSNNERATWVHPQVAINIAQWISPQFDVQVSKWIFELIITGSVQLGNEKSSQELDKLYKEQITKLETKLISVEDSNKKLLMSKKEVDERLRKLKNAHNKVVKRRSYHKFKEGPVFYVVQNKWCEEYSKLGISSDFNETIRQYRRNAPKTVVLFLVYLEQPLFVEECMKKKFKKSLTHVNHETLINLPVEDIKEYFMFLVKDFELDVMIEEDLNQYNDEIVEEDVEEDVEDVEDDVETDEDCESDGEDYEVDEESEEAEQIMEMMDKIHEKSIEIVAQNMKEVLIEQLTEQRTEIKKYEVEHTHCTKCGVLKPVTDFYLRCDQGYRNRRGECKKCKHKMTYARRKAKQQ